MSKKGLIEILVVLVILAIVLVAAYAMYNFILGLDIPGWLKFLLLR